MSGLTRVLVLCEYPSLNGGERSLLAVLPDLCRAGYQLRVAAPQCGPLSEALDGRAIERIAWDLRGEATRRGSLGESRRLLEALLRRAAPDLVHANSLSMARLAGPVADSLGIACLGHLRDILRLSRAAVEDLNRNRLLLAVSRATRDWHVAQGVSAPRTCVAYNGVDLERFRPAAPTGWLHREWGLPSDARLIAGIGQIGLRKGLDVWLEAAARIAAEDATAHFVIVGQRFSEKAEARDFEARLRRRAAEPPLSGRCHFLGVRDDIPALLGELSLLMHAARQEPLGRVLLEAAASGVPVVATRVGGTEEIFGAEAARLVAADDPAALAHAARELLQAPDIRRQLALAARRRMEQHFSRSAAAARLVEAYRAAACS